MTGTYAMGWPGLRFAAACGPDLMVRDWFAKMTGHRGHSGHRGQWGQWGQWGQPPFAGWGSAEGSPPFGPPWARGGRGPKARRGDVRAAILGVLADRSMNGYQIIQEIAERSRGMWKPSPGSIYPNLQQLEDEGLVRAQEDAGRRAYSLTEDGERYVGEHAEEIAAPWQAIGEPDAEDGIKPLIGQVAAAVWQIAAVGDRDQQAKGREALVELRKKLYAILAEGDDAEDRS